jgi:hypothetical protein
MWEPRPAWGYSVCSSKLSPGRNEKLAEILVWLHRELWLLCDSTDLATRYFFCFAMILSLILL